MSQRGINTYLYREALKELRLRIENTDPHFRGLKKLRMRGKGPKAIESYFTADEKEEFQSFSDEEILDENERNEIHQTKGDRQEIDLT